MAVTLPSSRAVLQQQGRDEARALALEATRAVLARAALTANAEDDEPPQPPDSVARRPRSLLEFLEAFHPGYRVDEFHRVLAGVVDHALARDCRHCLRPPARCTRNGHEYAALDRLIIECPPQLGKTEIVSVAAPAYYLGEHPDRYWVGASYEKTLTERNGRFARTIVSSPAFQWHYPLRLDRSKTAMAEWEAEGYRGGFYGVGVGGGFTGRSADVIVIDDPIKNRQDADSIAKRETVWGWYQSVVGTRINPETVVILVTTRWHFDDLVGRILNGTGDVEGQRTVEEGGRWRVVRIPALADSPEDPLGRAVGEPLMAGPRGHHFASHEEAFSWWADIRKSLGGPSARDWTSLYQQAPSLDEGAILKEAWWGWYDPRTDLPPGWAWTLQTWDTAYTEKTENDSNASLTFGLSGERIFILDGFNERLEFPELKKVVQSRALAWRPARISVEAKATGISIVQELRPLVRALTLWPPPGTPPQDKIANAYASQPALEAGRVLLPRWKDADGMWVSPEWVAALLQECAQFPAAAHDDYVDALTQGLLQIEERLRGMARAQKRQRRTAATAGIDPRYIDSDTGRAPSPGLVRTTQW